MKIGLGILGALVVSGCSVAFNIGQPEPPQPVVFRGADPELRAAVNQGFQSLGNRITALESEKQADE